MTREGAQVNPRRDSEEIGALEKDAFMVATAQVIVGC